MSTEPAVMNSRHMELFYNIGKYSGMALARRKMARTVQLPTMSSQIAQLEREIGVKLFERNPFALTRAGERLYRHARPYFEDYATVIREIRAEEGLHLGIGAPELVLRDYLADPIQDVCNQFPGLEPDLVDGDQESLEERMRRREIDVAVTIVDAPPGTLAERNSVPPSAKETANPPNRFCFLKLFELPLALAVPVRSKWKSAEDILAGMSRRDGPVAAAGGTKAKAIFNVIRKILMLPPKHAITRNFQAGLKQRGIDRFPTKELRTLDLVETYARKEHGIGVTVVRPGMQKIKGLRLLPLKDFKPVTFGILWQSSPNPQMTAFIEAVKARSALLKKT